MRCLYIIFYHRVLPENLKAFEKQIKILKKTTKIIDINEIENIEKNSVIITFDDGYFDNFVFAYPILKKYNVKATIFLITGKILPDGRRKTLNDYWYGKKSLEELINQKKLGDFLSWEEIKIMHTSGLINFQAHSHNHYSHFVDNKILKKPSRKLKNLNINWDKNYFFKISSYLKGFEYLPEKRRFETTEERKKRLHIEFLKPIEEIKKNLGYTPSHFCWPWGEYDEFSVKVAKSYGYKYFYTTQKGVICKNLNRDEIPRISSSFKFFTFLKRNFLYPNLLASYILKLKY